MKPNRLVFILTCIALVAAEAEAQQYQVTLTMPQIWSVQNTTHMGSGAVSVADEQGQPVASGVVWLESGNPAAVVLPLVQVQLSPQGSGSFTVVKKSDQVTACTNVPITASYFGTTASEAMTICPANTGTIESQPGGQAAGVESLTVTPGEVEGGSAATATITYSYGDQPIAADVVAVSLSSSDPAAVTIPSSVNVQGGVATVQVTTNIVSSPRTVTLSARANSFDAKTATLIVKPPPPPALSSLTLTPTQVVGGTTIQGSVQVDHVTASVAVNLTGNVPGLTFTPSQVTVTSPPSAAFSLETPIVGSETMVVVTAATGAAGERSARMKLHPLAFKFLQLEPAAVSAGQGGIAKLRLSVPAPKSFIVSLSSNPAGIVQIPTSITFQAGEIEKEFKWTTTRRLSRPVKVDISASIPDAVGQEIKTQAALDVQ